LRIDVPVRERGPGRQASLSLRLPARDYLLRAQEPTGARPSQGVGREARGVISPLRIQWPLTTKLWQGLLTLPPRRPKDRSPTRTPAGNLRSGRRRSGKTGWGHPLCGNHVSLYRVHFHRHWTGALYGNVGVPEDSAALNAPV